jgi:predicted AAA+ superfamily ATPase
LISRLAVYTKNPDREIVKAQKIYFSDSGLVNILTETSSGAKFENTLFNQLRHQGKIRYYSLKTGREIDFILNDNLAIEAKENPTATDRQKLADLAETAGLKNYRLIGRHQSPKFTNYIWGGDIR